MKKFAVFTLLIASLLIAQKSYAASYTSNASPVIVTVSTASPYRNITFAVTTRNLNILNGDSADAIWVDPTSDTNTNDLGRCYLVPAGQPLDLYDFATNGISIILDNVL